MTTSGWFDTRASESIAKHHRRTESGQRLPKEVLKTDLEFS